MKKFILQFLLAFGTTSIFTVIPLYGLWMYGNATGSIGMGGLEVLMIFPILLVIGAICLIIFISRMAYLVKKKQPIQREILYFVISMLFLVALGEVMRKLETYCFQTKCEFLPESNF